MATATPVAGAQQPILAPDRFLPACPINYEFPHLFIYLVEMEFIPETEQIQTYLKYPEVRDNRFFKSDAHLTEFESNMKKFAFPYNSTLKAAREVDPKKYATNNSSSLVQFYTFVLTDENHIRQYGFCRSAQGGNHIICLVSYLPWHNVLIHLLNKVATIINEKETSDLYNFLEAIYEYELPKPGCHAEILSHDGLDSFSFVCPDRRIVPSINKNRNLLKFFAFFDLEKIIKIFTALLLERHILIVSKDLENLTSCALSLEYLIQPLEWFYAFAPIMPEHINIYVFNQPFPFIYGIHPCIYDKLTTDQLNECVILKVDERLIINGDNDLLPDNVAEQLRRKLKFFLENTTEGSSVFYDSSRSNSSSAATGNGQSVNKYHRLLQTGTIQAFLDSVLLIVDDYRQYLKFDPDKNMYMISEDTYFQMKGVYCEKSAASHGKTSKKYFTGEKEFYHEFRITQAFEEFCRDRGDYLKKEAEFNSQHDSSIQLFEKDFIETLFEQFQSDNSKFQQLLKSIKKKSDAIRTKTKDNVSIMKKLLNQAAATTPIQQQAGLANPMKTSIIRKDSIEHSTLQEPAQSTRSIKADLFNTKKDRAYSGRLSTSSESSADSMSNEEKLKEAIRAFTNASDSVNMTLDKDLDELSKQVDLAIEPLNDQASFRAQIDGEKGYSRVDIDLTNDPDIKKYMCESKTVDLKLSDKKTQQIEAETRTDPQLIDLNTYPAHNESQIKSPVSIKDPFNLNQFSYQTPILNKSLHDKETDSSRSWLEEEINKSLKMEPAIPQVKPEPAAMNTYQSIIDEFDPMSSSGGSVISKVTHYNQLGNNQYSNLNFMTPKPFVTSSVTGQVKPPLPRSNYGENMFQPSTFTQSQMNMNKSSMIQSQSQHSIQSLINPTPFYGGYKNSTFSQHNFHSVAYPQSKVKSEVTKMSNNPFQEKEG